MSKNINNIDTYDIRIKVNTKKCRPIYEFIDEAYIKYSKLFPGGLLKNVKIIQTKNNLYRAR